MTPPSLVVLCSKKEREGDEHFLVRKLASEFKPTISALRSKIEHFLDQGVHFEQFDERKTRQNDISEK